MADRVVIVEAWRYAVIDRLMSGQPALDPDLLVPEVLVLDDGA